MYGRAVAEAEKNREKFAFNNGTRVKRTLTSEVQEVVRLRISETLQMKLINSAAKYIALGFVALSSTMFTAVVKIIAFYISINGYVSDVGILLQLIDALVNVIVLYMTYTFGHSSFHTFCSSIHTCCITWVSNTTFLEMKFNFQENEVEIIHQRATIL